MMKKLHKACSQAFNTSSIMTPNLPKSLLEQCKLADQAEWKVNWGEDRKMFHWYLVNNLIFGRDPFFHRAGQFSTGWGLVVEQHQSTDGKRLHRLLVRKNNKFRSLRCVLGLTHNQRFQTSQGYCVWADNLTGKVVRTFTLCSGSELHQPCCCPLWLCNIQIWHFSCSRRL